MNLNLGLESLNRVSGTGVVPFTPASAIEMQNASEAINNLMASLENYYDAARNAMLVKKAIRKYGQTQSIVALIGQEGLAAAQTFSMEGFWGKVKNFLIKIWEKIKEWWGRFWGMFFSVENRLASFESNVKSTSKKLAHPAEFDAPSMPDISKNDDYVREGVETIKDILKDPSADNLHTKIAKLDDKFNVSKDGAIVRESMGFATMHYKLEKTAVVKMAGELLTIVKDYKSFKKDIDEYTKKALEKVKALKTDKVSYKPAADHGAANGVYVKQTTTEDASSKEQDTATKTLKHAAKINNQLIAAVVKAATAVAIKLMAHTRLVD